MSRYDPSYKIDTAGLGASPEPQPKKKPDYLADFLRLAGGVAPAAGTVLGGLAGAGLGAMAGGVGAVPGAGIGATLGGALGAGAGALAGQGADMMGRDEREAEDMRVERERERQARQQAALSLLGQAR